MYSDEEAYSASFSYFNGNNLAAKVFIDKYALRDNENNILEKTPEDMHWRLAKEFARIEAKKFKNPLSEHQIFDLFKNFERIIPQGSPITAIGNPYQIMSCSNCYVVPPPEDSYGGILSTDQHIVQISKRRGGIGFDISGLRPKGLGVKNAARTTSGAISFMHRFSNSGREVGQCIAKGQKVLSKRGLIEIENIIPLQDEVWTKDGWIRVLDLKNNGIKQVFKLTAKSGFEIISSNDHIYQTFSNSLQETRLEDLSVGQKIVLCLGTIEQNKNYQKLEKNNYVNINNKPINCILPEILDEKLAYVIGYSYGNGYVEKDKFGEKVLELACPNDYPDIKSKLINNCQIKFNYNLNIRNGDGNLEKLSINNKTIVQWLKFNKLLKQKAGQLIFPSKIIYSPISVQTAFISGFLDADGDNSSTKSGYRISSIDKGFLQNIQKILMSIGIIARLHKEERKNDNWNTLYKLSINGKYNFNKANLYLKDSIKISKNQIISIKDDWISPFTLKSFGLKRKNRTYCSDNLLSLGVLDRLKSEGEFINQTLVQDSILSIEKLGEQDTFDLVLESEHLFWCEGFYVHNSGRRGAEMITISVHHPDILDFIKIKNDETSVTGANISVRLSNEFLNAVKTNKEYELRWPVDSKLPKFSKKVSAKEIWKEIIHSSWLKAEPGILFWNNILEGPADCYEEFKSSSTNPCCFSKLTNVLVKTKTGFKEIKDITNEDLIWDAVRNKFYRTSGYFDCGYWPTYIVSFKNNISFRVTSNHKFQVHCGELTKLEDLQIGSKISMDGEDCTKITNIEYFDIEPVGCIETEYHRLTANGIISGQSEIPLSNYDSCRLMAINLFSYVDNPFTKNAVLNKKRLYNDAKLAQRLMDDLIDIEVEQIDKIINKIINDTESLKIKEPELDLWNNIKIACIKGRRTGLGITALGDTIAALGVRYGSKESIDITDLIYKTIKFGAYQSSINIAKELEPFPVYNYELEKNNEFLISFKDQVLEFDDNDRLYGDCLLKEMIAHGRRNIALLTTAPTGTISLLGKIGNYYGVSSGIEPVFMVEFIRRKKINHDDKNAKVDFIDKIGDKWTEFSVYHAGFQLWMDITGKKKIEDSPYYKSLAEEIDWTKRVKLQAVAQRNICHAISSTLNLPEDVTEAEVAKIYETAWESGLKGITVYRKNCRSGVLVDKKEEKSNTRPKSLNCDVYHLVVKNKKWFVLVGLNDGKPYEVFAGKNGFLDKKIKTGKIIKAKRGYKVIFDDETEINPINMSCDEHEDALTRMTSIALRNNVKIHDIVNQLDKVDGDMTSFAKCISRSLKKYITANTPTGDKCEECQGILIYSDGCVLCQSCGTSKCS